MKKYLSKLVRFLIILGVIVFFLWDTSIENLSYIIENYSMQGIILTAVLIIISDLVIAYRWSYLSNFTNSLVAVFESLTISSLLNMILPIKLGELSRAIYLKNFYTYKIHNSIMYMAIEKYLDIIILAIIMVVAGTNIVDNEYVNILGIFIIVIAIFSVFFIKSKLLLTIVSFIPSRIVKIYFKKIIIKITSNFNKSNFMNTFIITIIIWFSYYITVYTFFNYASGFQLSLHEVLVVFLISTIAFALAITPGSLGVYELSIVLSLGWYGISKDEAIIAALLLRFVHFVLIITISIAVIMNKDINIKNLQDMIKYKKDV